MTEPTLIPFNPVIPFHGDVWGSPGGRQKEIRATVARFPYLQVERNDLIDVERIPRRAGA
jgi:hypothetical protein